MVERKGYGRLVRRWHAGMGHMVLIVSGLWLALAVALSAPAIIDVAFRLGRGHTLSDVLDRLGFITLGALAIATIWGIHRLVGTLNAAFRGPSPDENAPTQE